MATSQAQVDTAGLDRRQFLKASALVGASPMATLALASSEPAFLSAFRDRGGKYGVAAIGADGDILFTEALPARGHDTAISPDSKTAITFARRPGRFALVMDLTRRSPTRAITPHLGRHFFGHGFFSPDGALLYTSENAYDEEHGVIGVYDVGADYRRIGEFKSHGIGPHEALLTRDGTSIIVANGGILTHPDLPRQKLNIPTMKPSIVRIDRETGDLLDKVALPPGLNQLSLRHMAEDSQGNIWFGGQWQGARTDQVDLVGFYDGAGGIQLVHLPDVVTRSFNHYVGAVKANKPGTLVAFTSPRGGLAITVDPRTRQVINEIRVPDICGAAPSGGTIAFSTGSGDLLLPQRAVAHVQWDNHMTGRAGREIWPG
ncbi:MAG: DUF1513 domain-containing protein [Pseudomonadota bacterium]